MNNNKDKFNNAYLIVDQAKENIRNKAIQVGSEAIYKLLDVINSNLDKPLSRFLIRGFTPNWNDGEECNHMTDFGIPHITIQENTFGNDKLIYDELLEYEDKYLKMFPNSTFSDAYMHADKIRDGLTSSVILYNTDYEKKVVYDTLELIDQIIQQIIPTNYLVYGELQDNGQYDLSIERVEPDY